MAINLTLRLVKGSQLTYKELDDNFLAIKNAIEEANNMNNISGSTGYISFNNNWMIQWGVGKTSGNGRLNPVTFPVAFKNTCTCVTISEMNAIGWYWTSPEPPFPKCYPTIYGASSITKTGFSLSGVRIVGLSVSPHIGAYQPGLGYNYVAFGY